MRSISNARLFVPAVMCLASAIAQTPPPTTTNPCPSGTPPVLTSFSVERVINPAQVLSTHTPIFPPGVQPVLQANALELRESINFSAPDQLLTLNVFTVQTGAPIPTPPGSIPPASIVSILSIKVAMTLTTCTPNTSLMFVGTVATNSPPSLFGDLSGAPAAISVGLTNDTPAKITDVVELEAGTAVAYSAAGAGSITFLSSSVTPPTSGGGPNIVIKAPDLTTLTAVDLDASGTTSPNQPLSFAWTVVAGAADVANPKSAHALGYLLGSVGIYTFRLTVTDSKGNVSTKDVNIQLI